LGAVVFVLELREATWRDVGSGAELPTILLRIWVGRNRPAACGRGLPGPKHVVGLGRGGAPLLPGARRASRVNGDVGDEQDRADRPTWRVARRGVAGVGVTYVAGIVG